MNCVTSLLFSAPVQTWTYMGYIDKAEDIYYNLQEKKKSKKKSYSEATVMYFCNSTDYSS